jgi:Na+-translocating ferredoxin:NAD+ oxidoreductase RnfD subunit
MTPASTDLTATPAKALPPGPPPAAPPRASWLSADFLVRAAVTLGLVVAYYSLRGWAVESILAAFKGFLAETAAGPWYSRYPVVAAQQFVRATPAWLAAALLFSFVMIWRRYLAKDKRWHAPLLVTAVLIMADAGFAILESHSFSLLGELTGGLVSKFSPTFAAILAAVLAEALLGRFAYGKWPHLASSFVSGISAGILIKSPELWPFVACALISITSKYVLRIGDRHLWNPTNFGMTVMLWLAWDHCHSLGVEAGNEWAAAVVIWILGGLILYQLGRLHIPVAFVLAFVPLAFLRAYLSGRPWIAELAPVTSPMFQLYIFFMITDPKTTTKARWSQTLVAVLVAVAETFFRVAFEDVHSLYHALFTVGPIANLIEIAYFARTGKQKKAAIVPTSPESTAVQSPLPAS